MTNLYDHFFKQLGESKVKVTAVQIPYFDGDYWPSAAEDMINELCQDENDLKQPKDQTRKNINCKRTLKAQSHTDLIGHASKDAMPMEKVV